MTETIKVKTSADLGLVLRAVRRSHKLRLDDLAGCARVGHVFVRDLEHGKETVQLGRALQVLAEMGIHVHLSVPPGTDLAELERLRQQGLRPLKRRRRAVAAASTPDVVATIG